MEKQPNIYDLFRILADGNEILINGIDIIEGGKLPEHEAKKLAQDIWLAMVPTTPPGRRLCKDSIWSRGTGKFIWKALVIPDESKTRWLAQQIKWGTHKERVMHLPIYHQPLPSPRKW